ncbi:MAG: hypothetical protein D6710_06255, partial [Nitrospirae bacterium]
AALVIEANYSDFLNPERVRFYSPTFVAKALGELFAMHQGLSVVFAGNRKLAMEWTFRYFSAIKAHALDVPVQKVEEVVEKYGAQNKIYGGQFYEIKRVINEDFPEVFTRSMIKERFPQASESTITRVLLELKKTGSIRCKGKGKKSCWIKGGFSEEFSDS